MLSAKTHTGFRYLLQERHKAEEFQRGLKKTKWRPRAKSPPQCAPKLPSQTRTTFCYTNSVLLSLYYMYTGVIFPFANLIELLQLVEKQSIVSKAENKGKRQAGTALCLDPPLALLGTSEMHPLLHPPFQPSQSWGQAQAEGQKQLCFKSYSLTSRRWRWSSEDGKVPMPTLAMVPGNAAV